MAITRRAATPAVKPAIDDGSKPENSSLSVPNKRQKGNKENNDTDTKFHV